MDKPEPLEIRDKAKAAFAQLRIAVIERARQTGTPVVTWRNGRVCEIHPDDLEKNRPGDIDLHPAPKMKNQNSGKA